MSATGRAWAYIGALVGAGVSVAANVAHSYVPPAGAAAGWSPHPGAVVGAVFWPVALLIAIEVLARVAWPDAARWTLVRFGGLGPVAVVAAVVSYRHLSGLLGYYGEDPITATVGPLAVDGLMVMATGALLATSTTTAATAMSRRTGATRRAELDATPPAAATRQGTTAGDGRVRAARTDRPGAAGADIAAQVAGLRAEGLTTKQIAAELGKSERTIRRYTAGRGPAGERTTQTSTETGNETTSDEAMTEVAA
jgi:hypothetical protein